jgi:hypothetical protein
LLIFPAISSAPEPTFWSEFWKAVERGEDPDLHKKRGDNPLWAVIQRELR